MLISISGLKGSGKDTIAEFLVKEKGYIQLSFASALKDILAILFNWDRNVLEGKTKEDRVKREEIDLYWSNKLGIENFNMRTAMTHIGTEIFRNCFNENIWMYHLEKRILDILEKDPNANIVVSDTRFVNEIEALKALGAKTILVKRGNDPEWYQSALMYNTRTNKQKAREEILNSFQQNIFSLNIHQSEWDLVGYEFDTIIINSGTIEKLKKSVKAILLD